MNANSQRRSESSLQTHFVRLCISAAFVLTEYLLSSYAWDMRQYQPNADRHTHTTYGNLMGKKYASATDLLYE